jgi:hypothetical protein
MAGTYAPGPAHALGHGKGMSSLFAYIAAAVTGLWGVAHAVPTRQVLAGFAPIATSNRRVLLQEWLAEAVTMWGIAALIVVVTAAGSGAAGGGADVTAWVYRLTAGLLLALAALTAFTGARTPVIWFKVCPVLLTASAALLLVASFL